MCGSRTSSQIACNETDAMSLSKWTACLFVNALVLACAVFGWWMVRPRLVMSVQNSDTEPMNSVVLHVTGASYSIGDIDAGETISTEVYPTGDSHLEVEFSTEDEPRNRVAVDSYFGPGWDGTLRVSIREGQIESTRQQFAPGVWP